MTTRKTHTIEHPVPDVIVRQLLGQVTPGQFQRPVTAAVARRVQSLERQAPRMVQQAQQAGVEIEYLGVSPLFPEARLYSGVQTDWVCAPADLAQDAIVPRRERHTVQRLAEADLHWPLIYVAHEIPKDKTNEVWTAEHHGHLALERTTATDLVGPTPAPIEALKTGDRLAERSQQILRTVGRGAKIAGIAAVGVAAVQVVVVGAALAAMTQLDPIILGAIPARRSEPGEPAAWYILARWDW